MAKSPKKPGKARPDLNQIAFRIVQEATGQKPRTPDPDAGKNPAAVELGRRGGLARKKSMTKKARAASAKKAAAARWGEAKG
jgi:hypothetical protein